MSALTRKLVALLVLSCFAPVYVLGSVSFEIEHAHTLEGSTATSFLGSSFTRSITWMIVTTTIKGILTHTTIILIPRRSRARSRIRLQDASLRRITTSSR